MGGWSTNAWGGGQAGCGPYGDTLNDTHSGSNSRPDIGGSNLLHLPALNTGHNHNAPRQYILSRDSTRPRPRKDRLKVDGSGEQLDNVVTKRVEDAMAAARKLKDRVREDRASGVPVNFDLNFKNDIKITQDERNLTKEMRKARKMKQNAAKESHRNGSSEQEEKTKEKYRKERKGDRIPGKF